MIVAIMATALSGTVWAESVEINTTNFTKPNSGSGYAAYDGTRTISGVNVTSSNVMVQSSNLQFKKSSGYLYNTTAMPGNITKITLGTATNFTIYVGTTANSETQTVTSGSAITGNYTFFKVKCGSSTGTTATITIEYTTGGNPIVATPTFSPAEGAYTSAQNVEISTTTTGATIYYTTDGNDPTTSSSVYSSAISVSTNTTIKAMAVKDGMDNSSIASATYTIKIDPALAFSSNTAEAAIGQAFTAPTLTNDHNLTVTWSSTDEDVATVSDGVVTLVGVGTTTIKASYAEDDTYIASEASYTLTVTDPSVITLWSEDFSSYSADGVPNGGKYSYACTNGNGTTKVYAQNNAGGESPELLVAKSNGSFTAVVPLNNASGNLTLTYKTNAKKMKVSTSTEDISIQDADSDDGSISYSTSGTHTVIFTGVTTAMTSITIVFTATSGDNVRLDDIMLTGHAEPVSVEAPTFSVNGGTYYTTQSVELSCETDGATIYYTTNGDEPTSSSTEYTGAITVSETMTIKAIAIKGGDESTVSSATYTITEKNDVVFSITDKSIAYGETYTVTRGSYTGRDIQTDGFVTVSTDNAAVASVSEMTITAEAVGTATITLTAAEGDTYKAGSKTITITVTAPTGQITAPAVPALFNETFDKCDGTGGHDGAYSGSVGTSATTGKLDESWTTIGNNGAYKCIKLGTNSATGSVTTSEISLTGNGTLTFSAAGWGTGDNTVSVSAEGATLSGDTEVTLEASTWNTYTVNISEATGTVAITFAMKRGFLDDVKVIEKGATAPAITATLNGSGYATFCSEYPLDFSGVTDFSAWQITGISSSNEITFEQVTGSVKGGTGLFLKGEAGATVTIPSADSSNELTGNKLVGTLAPSYFAENQIYGLAGNTFKKNSAGSIRANKAYIPANLITVSGSGNGGGAKAFTFIFDDEATGIKTIETVSAEEAAQIFNLAGQRINKMQKGINIVNGKKIMVK